MRLRAFLQAACILLPMAAAHAQISKETLANITLADRRGAVLPPVALHRLGGGSTRLPSALNGHPALLLLVDYTCSTMCGTTVGVLAQALEQTPMVITRDYSVFVIGFDPKDGDEAAAAFRDSHLQANRLAADFGFLRGSRDSITTLARAIGFSSAYDAARDQFAHPAAAIVVTPDWHISRALDALDLTPFNLRLAITEAADGRTGTLSERIALLCYGWDAATGTYTLRIRRVLAVAGGITVAVLLGLVLFLRRREKLALREEHRG